MGARQRTIDVIDHSHFQGEQSMASTPYPARPHKKEAHLLDRANTVRSMIWPAYLVIGVALLGIAVFGSVYMKRTLTTTFLNNLAMNSMIVGTFIVGLLVSLLPLFRMSKDFQWLKNHLRNIPRYDYKPTYLTKFAQWFLLKKDADHALMPANERHQALLNTENRLYSARDLPKYFIGMLIFLGLLGTLWGLSQTIRSVSNVISNLPVDTHSMVSFQTLKDGLREPLSGMGTAFGCSMFGLAGSLILGFIELVVKQTQKKFFYYVELATSSLERGTAPAITQLQLAQSHPEYLVKVLEFMAENLELLTANGQHASAHTHQMDQLVVALCDKMEGQMAAVHALSQSTHGLAQSTVATQSVVESLKTIEEELLKTTKDQQRNQALFLETFRKEMRLLGKILHRDSLLESDFALDERTEETSSPTAPARPSALRSRTEFIR